jgi:hypothetical protein
MRLLVGEHVEHECEVSRSFPDEQKALGLVPADVVVSVVIHCDHPEAGRDQRLDQPPHVTAGTAGSVRDDNQRNGRSGRGLRLPLIYAEGPRATRFAIIPP